MNYDLNDVDGALYLQHTNHVQSRNCEFANLGVGAGRHQGGRLAARHFLRKTGTAEHRGLQPGRHGGLDLVTKQAR